MPNHLIQVVRGCLPWLLGFVVCAAIFAALFGKNVSNGMLRGPAMTCRSNLRYLAGGLEQYAEEHNGDFPKRLDQLAPKYFQVLPVCPRDRRGRGYEFRTAGRAFQIACSCEHTRWWFWRDTLNYSPKAFRYDSRPGLSSSFELELPWPPSPTPSELVKKQRPANTPNGPGAR